MIRALLWFAILLNLTRATAATPIGEVELVAGSGKIEGLSWELSKVPAQPKTKGEDTWIQARVPGIFQNPGWTLINGSEPIKLDTQGKFEIVSEIRGGASTLRLFAVGPTGEMESLEVGLLVREFAKVQATAQAAPPKRLYLSPSLTVTPLYMTDSRIGSLSQTGINLRVNANYLLVPPMWDIGASAYITAFVPIKSTAYSARFFGANLRAGYVLPYFKDPWRVGIQVGWYYTTMLPIGDGFGFRNLMGPQLYPTFRRQFKNGMTLMSYFKFSPITNGLQFLTLGNRELAAGASMIFPLSNGHSVSAALDYSNLSLSLSGTTILVSALSIGVGYVF